MIRPAAAGVYADRMVRSKHHLTALVVGAMTTAFFVPDQASAAGGFRQEKTLRFLADSEGTTAFLRGFDIHKGTTKKACLETATKTKFDTSGGDPAVSAFAFVRTTEEVFERENTEVEVRAQVRYLAASASVGVRHEVTREAAGKIDNGAIHAFHEKTDGVKWVKNSDFRLTSWAKALHDKAVEHGDMQIFYRECGEGAIVGKQYGKFFKAIGTLDFTSSMSTRDKKLAVDAALAYAGVMVKVAAGVEVNTESQEFKKYEQTRVSIHATWSGNPKIENPTDFAQLRKAYNQFTNKPNTKDLLSVRVVPYEEVIPDFGGIGEDSGINRARRAKVQKILNGLAFYEAARAELRLREDGFGQVAAKYVGREHEEARKIFVKEKACLRDWSEACEHLVNKFEAFPKLTRAAVKTMADTMTQLDTSCPAASWAVVNAKGYTTCRQCDFAEQPVFVNGKGGKCGTLDEPKDKNSVRLKPDALGKSVKTQIEAGVWSSVLQRPDVCTKRGKDCDRKRADAICKSRGFAGSSDFGTMKSSPTYYAGGDRCVQREEQRRPAPQQCRTFRFVDCACPAGKKPKNGKCS